MPHAPGHRQFQPFAGLFNRRQGGQQGQQQANPFSGLPVLPPRFGNEFINFPGVDPLNQTGVRDVAKGVTHTVLPFLAQAAPTALGTGLGTLNDVIASQGATDPALLNRQLADISRTGQSQQDALRGQLAAMGLSGSAAGLGLQQAVGLGTANTRAQAIAEETARAEERKRQDLINLLLPFFVDPALASQANLFGLAAGAGQGPSDLEKGLAAATGFIDAVVPF